MNTSTRDTDKPNHPCPACGFLVFTALNEQSEICPICGWQNDVLDLQELYEPAGPNKVSLEQAQINFVRIGAKSATSLSSVRRPNDCDYRDPNWRPVDKTKDKPKAIDVNSEHFEDLYYWYQS